MLTVKEFSEQTGRTPQAVYQQLKRKTYRDVLKGHIKTTRQAGKKVLLLDDEAVRILSEGRLAAPVVINQTSEEIEQLRNEVQLLTTKIVGLQDALIGEQQKVQLLQEKMLLLEQQKKPGIFARLFGGKKD